MTKLETNLKIENRKRNTAFMRQRQAVPRFCRMKAVFRFIRSAAVCDSTSRSTLAFATIPEFATRCGWSCRHSRAPFDFTFAKKSAKTVFDL